MRRASSLALLAFALGAAVSLPAYALRADRDKPIKITADSVSVDQKTGVSHYRGNVVLTQGTLRVEADRVTVRYHKGTVDQVSASGRPVTFRERPDDQDRDILGSALRLEYSAASDRIDLFDQVSVQQGDDILRSSVLHYDLAKNSLRAEGLSHERVQTTIQPNKPPTAAGTGSPKP